jgi:lipopolysaccharide export system permease protein
MRRFDRYIFSEFVKAFLLSLFTLSFMFLMITILESQRVESKAKQIHFYLYYLYTVPNIVSLVIPAALMFGVCFTVAQFTVSREMVAIHSAGISFYRAVMPVLISGLFVSIFLFAFKNFAVTPVNRLAAEERAEIYKDRGVVHDVIWQKNLRGKRGYYFLYYYDRDKNRVIGGFHYLEMDPEERPLRMVQAKSAQYDAPTDSWTLKDVTTVLFDDTMQITGVERDEKSVEVFPEDLDFFSNPSLDPSEMNVFELYREIERRKRIGLATALYDVEFHAGLSFPFMSAIIALVGSLAGGMGNLRSGGPLIRSILLSTITIFVYELTFRLGMSLGTNGVLPPVMAGWGPTGVMMIAAYFLVRKNRK